ncbi:MAG: ATP-binding protein [Desulfobacteraceae bacterium]
MTSLNRFKKFYKTFREISQVVHSTTDMDQILEKVVLRTTQGISAKGAVLCLLKKDSSHFTPRASYGIGEKYLALKPLSGKELLSWPENNKIHIINNIFNAPRVKYPQEAWDEGVRMMIDVPLLIDNQLTGFIRIYFAEQKVFSDDERDFIQAVAEQCACAINHDEEIKSHIISYNKLAIKIDRMSSLGRMAAGIAHEINNPLTGILLYSSNLLKKTKGNGPYRDGLEIIMNETQRCKTIIQGLLDFSREKKLEKVNSNINKVMEKSLVLMENEFLIKRIEIIRDFDCSIPEFLLDSNQMEQVFINLLLNSAHSVDEKGTITIRTRFDKEKNRVIIEVEDTGCGIPMDDLKKIFEPFYTTKPDGTGLGLAVSYGIIKKHKGSVKIFSELDLGTTITIALPILPEHQINESTKERLINESAENPDY